MKDREACNAAIHGDSKNWTWLSNWKTTTKQISFKTQPQFSSVQFSSVTQLCPTLQPHGLQHAKLPCLSPTLRACSKSCPLNQWCHPTISPYVILFSSCLQSFPASGCFPNSQFFTLGGQSIGASALASVLLMNIQDWFSLELIGLISLQSKGLPRVFSNTTVHMYQFFYAQLSSRSNFHTQTLLLKKKKKKGFDYMDLCWQSNVSAFLYTV